MLDGTLVHACLCDAPWRIHVAELAILRAFREYPGQNVIYIAPLKVDSPPPPPPPLMCTCILVSGVLAAKVKQVPCLLKALNDGAM